MNPDTPRSGRRDPVSATSSIEPLTDSSVPGPDSPASVSAAPLPAGIDDFAATEPRGRSRLLGSVKQKATSQLNAQKDRATDELEHIAQAVRESTAQLRSERHDIVAQVVERAADHLERLAGHLRHRDIDDLFAQVERFGRQQPALFLGSSFAAGLLAARFLKASDPGAAGDRIWFEEGRG